MIGKPFGSWLNPEIWQVSQPPFVFKVTGLCAVSQLTLRNRLDWSVLSMSSGVKLELESQGALGTKLVSTLTLKIPEPNSGVVTLTRRTLSLMNLEEVSTSPICFDGLIGTLSLWKLKGELSCCELLTSGSLQTCAQIFGFQTSTFQPEMPY